MNFTLDWSLGAQSITLRLRAATSGWLGVGFSETGHMLGADIVTVSVDATSNITTVTDRNCPWSAMPLQSAPSIFPVADSPQCSQDWGLVCGFGTAAYTEVWITRQLNTGDPQDRQLGAGLTTLIYAWGGSGASSVAYHGANRGSLSVDFGTSGATPAFVPPSDTATYVDLNFSTYLTYGVDTQYVCQGFQLDGSQRHVVAVNVLLPSGPFLPLIHHVLVGVALSCGGWCWCDVAVFVVVAFGVHHCVCVCVLLLAAGARQWQRAIAVLQNGAAAVPELDAEQHDGRVGAGHQRHARPGVWLGAGRIADGVSGARVRWLAG